MNGDLILADIIFVFHVLIVLFMLLAPFSGIPALLILHIVFGISLVAHWATNNNICSLTVLEGQLRGVHHTEGFLHKFIGPIYDICETDWSRFCYILTILLMLASVYNLYHSKDLADSLDCYNELKNDTEIQKKSYFKRMKMYSECFAPLFKLKL
jgi:hypothetical protein